MAGNFLLINYEQKKNKKYPIAIRLSDDFLLFKLLVFVESAFNKFNEFVNSCFFVCTISDYSD